MRRPKKQIREQGDVRLKVEVTDGFERRYTQAVLEAYQRKANRENRTVCGVFHPVRGGSGVRDRNAVGGANQG